MNVQTKGVDSVTDETGGVEVAKDLAARMNCVAAVTGKTDIITNGKAVCSIANGHPILAHVTGTGCMATALVGTYCGVVADSFIAAAAGVMTMGLAGELAQRTLQDKEGIGTFRVRLFDSVYNLGEDTIRKEGRIKLLA